MNYKLEQPILGALGSDGIFREFATQTEAFDYKFKLVRRLEHGVICKHNGAGPADKTLAELEREVEEAKQLEVVVV